MHINCIIICVLKYLIIFFNITGSPLDPKKILEYQPLPFEEILLQRRREKNPARIDPTPSHVMYLFTQDLCLHFISLPAVDDERKKVCIL